WSRHSFLARSALRLCGTHPAFAFDWLKSPYAYGHRAWRSLWACSRRMRLELRVKIDAMVAALYGLRPDEFRFLLRDCDHPKEQMQDADFCRTLEQKGFWRVDKEHDPELRHTVLSVIAFQDLYSRISHEGLDDACSSFAEHWSLPQYLQLSEYGLGHDERAQKKQPVAERLGEYLLDWQTEDPEESWKECRKWSDQIAVLFTGEQI
ncbi:MAG: hypothetical protein VX278_16265, partial [Myxococcota bacterium]|nr:hypothetical protein [Myxococcota bacterium]